MQRLIRTVVRGVDWLWAAYRVYMATLLFLAGPVLMLAIIGMLVLWFGFGIRWGW